MKISILGSCITRDIFREMKLDHLVKSYRARTSIHSIIQEQKANSTTLSLPESNFQKRMVLADFNKDDLELKGCEFLIIDLIDERFDLITNFGSVITLSNEIKQNNLIENKNLYVERGTELDYSLWRKAVRKLSNKIDIPIIIHKSRLSHKLNIDTPAIDIDYGYIDKMNEILSKYEEIIYDEIEVVGTISVPNELLISDVNHVWNYSPYHYIKPYYEEALNQIFEITKTNKQVDLELKSYRFDLKFSDNILETNITTEIENVQFAYYVFHGNDIIHKEWYTNNKTFSFRVNFEPMSTLKVKVFIKNKYNQILTSIITLDS